MKKMSYSLSGMVLGGAMAALLSGCGGGNDALGTIGTAYLVDGAVSGVTYRCGNQAGTTGTDGKFLYQQGQECTFNIGATSFSVDADKLANGKSITPYDIFDGDDEKAINLARMLQTMDADGNPENGISITEQVRNQIQSQIRFDANFEGDMTAAMNQVRAQVQGMEMRQVRTQVQALQHLAANVEAPAVYSTFERIAEIDAAAIATASGTTNTTDQARYVAQKIAKYFNDSNDLTTGYSIADWVLGGSTSTGTADDNITHYNPYILEIPYGTTKTMIVEVCNKTHAGGAIAGSTIAGGEGHGPALPCEIAVYTDEATGKIYVDILDPVGSFAIFFNDLGSNPQLAAMALQVKTEIKLITYKGLDAGNIEHEHKSTPMGATFTPTEIAAMSNQFLTYTYDINTNDSAWQAAATTSAKRALANTAALKLIEKMTVNIPYGYSNTFVSSPYIAAGSYGINGTDLNATLVGSATYPISSNGYWRSARKAPLSVPRDVNTSAYGFMYTVEACSPTYAKMALGMAGDSRDHATALPCQMSFYIDDSNPAAPKLKVVFLNPVFMFQTLFKDKMSGLSTTEQTSLGAMAETVKTDLVNITRYAMDHSGIGWIVPNP